MACVSVLNWNFNVEKGMNSFEMGWVDIVKNEEDWGSISMKVAAEKEGYFNGTCFNTLRVSYIFTRRDGRGYQLQRKT